MRERGVAEEVTWMRASARSATEDARRDGRHGTAGPGIRMPMEERHALAVRQSLRWAERAASEGDYERALGWLRMVEQVGRPLEPQWRRRRAQWRAARTKQLVQPERALQRVGASADGLSS